MSLNDRSAIIKSNRNIHHVVTLLEQASLFSERHRIDFLTRLFMGKPYLTNPLGISNCSDESLCWRLDQFDCVTYVGVVLSLYFSSNWYEFQYHLAQLNYYSGNMKFENRFHFMSVDWNSENAAKGYVYDLTELLKDEKGWPLCRYAYAKINKPAWAQGHTEKQGVEVTSRHFRQKDACTAYLALTDIFSATNKVNDAVLEQLPNMAIVEIIRPGWDLVDKIGTQLNVSHVGFLVKKNQRYLFRHASQELGAVVEHDLIEYLRNCLPSPTIRGVNIQAISVVSQGKLPPK